MLTQPERKKSLSLLQTKTLCEVLSEKRRPADISDTTSLQHLCLVVRLDYPSCNVATPVDLVRSVQLFHLLVTERVERHRLISQWVLMQNHRCMLGKDWRNTHTVKQVLWTCRNLTRKLWFDVFSSSTGIFTLSAELLDLSERFWWRHRGSCSLWPRQ